MNIKNNITFKNLLQIIITSLDYMDESLAGHSTRIAYNMMSFLKNDSRFTYEEICKITWSSLFHDIGILEKRPIADLIAGEENSAFSHSEYGSLFMKYFSPFPEYHVMIKYHHTPYHKLALLDLDEKTKDLCTFIYIIDKLDLYQVCNKEPNIEQLTQPYTPEITDAIKHYVSIKQERSQEEMQAELLSYLENMELTEEQQVAFLNILINSFDFRSRYTAIHCATVTAISDCLAKIYHLDEETSQKIHLGALLHDMGKIAIPHRILESPDKLNDEDWEIMESHALLTEKILKDRVDDTVLKIAIRHHERLDGTGYPYQISEKDLTLPERIVAVADIISALSQDRSYKKAFSLDKICEIITEMSESGKICPSVCASFLSYKNEIYDYIMEIAENRKKQYEQITNDYKRFAESKKQ